MEAIIEATTRIIESDGLDGLNTNRAAELAGVSVGSPGVFGRTGGCAVSPPFWRHGLPAAELANRRRGVVSRASDPISLPTCSVRQYL